jgi:hypothetical protein
MFSASLLVVRAATFSFIPMFCTSLFVNFSAQAVPVILKVLWLFLLEENSGPMATRPCDKSGVTSVCQNLLHVWGRNDLKDVKIVCKCLSRFDVFETSPRP